MRFSAERYAMKRQMEISLTMLAVSTILAAIYAYSLVVETGNATDVFVCALWSAGAGIWLTNVLRGLEK